MHSRETHRGFLKTKMGVGDTEFISISLDFTDYLLGSIFCEGRSTLIFHELKLEIKVSIEKVELP